MTTGTGCRWRVTETVTSPNGTPTGACGLCTVTVTSSTALCDSASPAMTSARALDEVEGLTLDASQRRSADLAVVDGVDEVVTGPGRGEVDGQRDVDDELLPLAALVLEDPVEPAAPHPR
jgi:hypothetical protein